MTIIAPSIIETNNNFITLPFLKLKEPAIFNHAMGSEGEGFEGEGGEGEGGGLEDLR